VRGEITAVVAKEREENDLVCEGILTVETSDAAHKRLISLFLGWTGEVGMWLPRSNRNSSGYLSKLLGGPTSLHVPSVRQPFHRVVTE
jgi:hypothetical protein